MWAAKVIVMQTATYTGLCRINPGLVQPESYKPCSLLFGIQEPWNRVGELRWKIVVGGKELGDCV